MKAVLFDLDNTLYSYDNAHRTAIQALTDYAARNLELDGEAFAALHRSADRLLRARAGEACAAIHNRLIRYQIMLEKMGRPIAHAPRMAGIYWSAFLAGAEPDPAAAACLAGLREGGYLVGIGTNMTADYQFAKLERMDLLRWIDFMVTSEEAGAEKPDGRLFALCAQKAGCLARDCVFVGDSLVNDARGAKAAGMVPVWLRTEVGAMAEDGIHSILSLNQLPSLLQELSQQEKRSKS